MREAVAGAKRVVVKVGSSSLTSKGGRLDGRHLFALVDALASAHEQGRQVVLVSSGAIAAGMAPLGMRRRPVKLAEQQAAASVGQRVLLERYASLFGARDITIGQVLLTVNDVNRKVTYANAQRTLTTLLRMGVVPIVNENDTVATHEIHVGDNDRLAALVAHMTRADALVLLSDVDRLYTAHPSTPGAVPISEVDDVTTLMVDTSRAGSEVGTGGMTTKLEAARIATASGIPVLLTSADLVAPAMRGEDVGTLFHPIGKRRSRKLLWLAYASKTHGDLILDAGAVDAVVSRQASLLPAGIVGVRGDFHAGDPVRLLTQDGRVVARGLVNYDAADLPRMMGRTLAELITEGGRAFEREVVHRDELMVR